MLKGSPSISIVVPNYNGAATLERTLKSLLGQRYPALEIVVIDGGSTDGSVEIIRQYEPKLAFWVSEKDRGQTHALNKGFARCTGEVASWLCSDDFLLPGALEAVGRSFAQEPAIDVVVGRLCIWNELTGEKKVPPAPTPGQIAALPAANYVGQPSCFFRRSLLERDPPLDETLDLAMDVELWSYFRARGAKWKILPDVLSTFCVSASNKTSVAGERIARELVRIYRKHSRDRIPLTALYQRLLLPVERWRGQKPPPLRRACAMIYKALYVLALGPFYGFRRVYWMNLGAD